MTAWDMFAACVTRVSSRSDRPWESVDLFRELADEVLPGPQPHNVASRVFNVAGMDTPTAKLPRLLRFAVGESNSSDNPDDALRKLTLAVPNFLLDHFVALPSNGQVSAGLADGHVHFGGAIGEVDILNSLLRMKKLSGLKGVAFRDRSGRKWAVEPVISELRNLVAAAQFTVRDLDVLTTAYWRSAVASDLDPPPNHRPNVLFSHEDVVWSGNTFDGSIQIDAADLDVTHLARVIAVGSAPGWSDHAIDGATHLLGLFHQALASPERSSLDRFVDDFDRTSALSKIGLAREQRFSSAIRWAGAGLEKLELRKTYAVPTNISATLREDLDALIGAIRSNSMLPDLVVQMPLTFLKSITPTDYPTRFTLKDQILIAEEFVEFIFGGKISTMERGLVASVDVVGKEQAQPNWIYIAAMNHLAASTRESVADATPPSGSNRYLVEMTAHAGESFLTPLAGIRSIREYVDHVPWMVRIGHGVALGEASGLSFYEGWRPERTNAFTVLENLVWSDSVSDASERNSELQAICCKIADEIMPVPGGIDWTSGALRRWYQLRFSLSVLRNELGHDRALSLQTEELEMCTEADASTGLTMFLLYASRSAHLKEELDLSDLSALSDADLEFIRQSERSLFARERVRTVAQLNRKEITVEICPSSNCALHGIGIAEHPLMPHLDDFECTLNSDDPLVFGSRLINEVALVASVATGPQVAKLLERAMKTTAAGVDKRLYERIKAG